MTDTAHALQTTPLVYPARMQWIEVPTNETTFELYGRFIDAVDNERRGRPRWAHIELYEFLDTDETHNERNPKPELRTYGQVIYLIHTMGHSVVYHEFDSDCNKGVEVEVQYFPERAEFPLDELEPCEKCVPPPLDYIRRDDGEIEWGGATPPGTKFDLEVLRHTPIFCPTAEDVLDGLRRHIKIPCGICGGLGKVTGMPCEACDGRGFTNGPKTLTSPGARLVEKVKFKDPRIRKAVEKKKRL